MKLPDVKVLIFCVNRKSRFHDKALAWMIDAMAAPAGVSLAWTALLGFIRISTHPKILEQPLSIEDALLSVRDWIEAPRARIVQPTANHLSIVGRLLMGAGTAGNLTSDAHLAALAIEHGATLASFDRDFERFAGLDFERLDR